MHKIVFVKSWILDISARLGAAGTEGAYIPLVLSAFNRVASAEIFLSKFDVCEVASLVEKGAFKGGGPGAKPSQRSAGKVFYEGNKNCPVGIRSFRSFMSSSEASKMLNKIEAES